MGPVTATPHVAVPRALPATPKLPTVSVWPPPIPVVYQPGVVPFLQPNLSQRPLPPGTAPALHPLL